MTGAESYQPPRRAAASALASYDQMIRTAMAPALASYDQMIRTAAAPALASYDQMIRTAAAPALASHDRAIRAAMAPAGSSYNQMIKDALMLPDLAENLRRIVVPVRLADSIMSSIQGTVVDSVIGFQPAVDALFRSMGFEKGSPIHQFKVEPTSDDTAFRIIAEA